jgi:hypothetical protein
MHTTVTFYGDCVNMGEYFTTNFSDKRTGCCFTTTLRLTFLFHEGIFYQKRHDVTPTLLFFVSPIEDKAKGRHFDTIEVIDAESQAVLNTLREHDIQDAFKNIKRWEMCLFAEGDYFEGDCGQ